MLIGIDGSRAFIKNRTGIEEYSYQVIRHLRDELKSHQVVLYVKKTHNLQLIIDNGITKIDDLELPSNWKIKVIRFPRFWTQIGLSLEMLLHPVDVLFVPAHTVPIIHPASTAGGPKKTVVVVHGLEYEFCPEAYSFLERVYMRVSIKNSCRWASQIIAVSENTKKDLMNLYKVTAEKISVIYEGYEQCHSERSESDLKEDERSRRICAKNNSDPSTSFLRPGRINYAQDDKHLLFIGRIEERKNIGNIVKAFEILKEKYNISHKLVLAGKPGHNYENIKLQITNSKYQEEIQELGFVSEQEKWELLKGADVFVFPTLYEGFGIPVLEAQSVGCPVVASNNSSVPEVVTQYLPLPPGEDVRRTGEGGGSAHLSALLVDPQSPEDIAENIYRLISDEKLKNAIIEKGLENVKRFSWDKCANSIGEILVKKN